MQGCLYPLPQHLIVRPMSNTLTDIRALNRNRQRALKAPEFFLHEQAASEVKDRLTMVNRTFSKVGLIGGFPSFWGPAFPQATPIEDAETLEIDECAFDLIIHAMCLHWSSDPVGQLIQAKRALKPDGLFLAVFFGGRTLHELRASLGQAEVEISGGLSRRIAPMVEIRDAGALLQRAGFALPVADSLSLPVMYESPGQLMHDLRAMGENNALEGRPNHFSSQALFSRASEIYAGSFGQDGGRIPATFELLFLTGWAPDASQPKALLPGSASVRLADALGTKENTLKD